MYPSLSLKMQTLIGPQMVIACQLLRASAEEVEQMLDRELQENPALALTHAPPTDRCLEHPYAQTGWGDPASEAMENHTARQTILEHLEAQAVLLVNRADREVMLSLLHLLDAHGYLRQSPGEIAALTGAPPEQISRVMVALHQLEPPGIGASDLQECLLIQCAHLQEEGVACDLPRRILAEAWDDLAAQHWGRVARKVAASTADVDAARQFITSNLYPYPLRMVRSCLDAEDTLVFPDLVIIRMRHGQAPHYRLEIPGEEQFQVRLSCSYELNLQMKMALTGAERDWVNAQTERARVFIASLEQRWTTLRLIGECLIAEQADFLERGPRWLRPITRAAVAERVGLHESTISRAVSDKTVQLPDRRIIPMSDLFDASLPVKEALRRLLTETGVNLSDREIAERLKTEGLVVARRTIGKYREQLHIPNRNLRQAV